MNHILIYTPDEDSVLAEKIEAAGFTPHIGTDTSSVVRLAQDHYPIAIIVDLLTNADEGLMAIDNLRNHTPTAMRPIIANVPADEAIQEQALAQGARELLVGDGVSVPEIKTRLRSMIAIDHHASSESGDAAITEHRLMGSVALLEHDMRSPTGIALSSLDLLQEILQDETDAADEIFELVNNCVIALNRQLFIVQDFVDWVRLEANQFELQKGSIDINLAIRRGIEKGILLAEGNGVKVVVDIDDNLPSVAGDEKLFTRVVNATLDCIIKFCMRGQQITISAYEADDMLVVDFVDNGKPIMKQYRNNKLFDLDRQSEARHLGSRSSVALGLPFIRAAVRNLNGQIDLISDDENDLTTLRIQLPN